jgi:hypothetical protein
VVKFESAKETSIVNETLVNRHHLSVVKFESLNHGDEHNLGGACLRGAVEEQESGAREKVQGGGVLATGRMSTWRTVRWRWGRKVQGGGSLAMCRTASAGG